MTDDGFNIGVLYRGKRAPYQPKPLAHLDPSHLEAEFAI
jgi:2-oxoglutarate ferredoxin oxidoreductase subunit beta